jgi:HEAT repeat protein
VSVDAEIARLSDPDWAERVRAARALVFRSSGRDGPRQVAVSRNVAVFVSGEEAIAALAAKRRELAAAPPAPLPDRASFEPGDARAVAPLLAAAEDPTKNVRTAVARALGVVAATSRQQAPREQLRDALGDERPRLRFAAARAYALLPDEPAAPLLPLLQDTVESVRWAAARTLASRKNGGIGHLSDLGFLVHDRRRPEPELAEALRQSAVDEAPTVRRAAVLGLRAADPGGSYDLLVQALRADEDHRVRAAAAYSLDDERAIPVLVEALDDPCPVVGRAAIFALARLRAPSALDPLVAQLRVRNRLVRHEAVVALAALGDARAVEPLRALYDRTTTHSLRHVVARALATLGAA